MKNCKTELIKQVKLYRSKKITKNELIEWMWENVVKGIAKNLAKGRWRAEDTYGDSFEGMLRFIKGVDVKGDVGGYIYVSVRNSLIENFYKRHGSIYFKQLNDKIFDYMEKNNCDKTDAIHALGIKRWSVQRADVNGHGMLPISREGYRDSHIDDKSLISYDSDHNNSKFEELIEGMGDTACDMLRMRYIDRMSFTEIGKKYGYGENWAWVRHGEIIDKLREKLTCVT